MKSVENIPLAEKRLRPLAPGDARVIVAMHHFRAPKAKLVSDAGTPSDVTNAPAAPRRTYLGVVTLLMLMVAIGHFNRVGISVAGAEKIMKQYQLSETEMGKVYSAFLLAYTLAMLPGGWLLDRFGPRRMLMTLALGSAMFVALTGCVGLAFCGSHKVWLGLMIVRSLLGAVNAPLHPSAARMVFEQAPAAVRATANGMVTMAACLGIAGTYYGFGELIDRLDWPGAFLVCGVLTLAAAGIWSVGTRARSEAPSRRTGAVEPPLQTGAMWRALARRGVIFVTLSYTAQGYFQYLFFYWIEYYFETVQKQGVEVARQYSTVVMLMMGAGMVFGGWLTDRASGRFSSGGRRGLVPASGMIASGVIFELGLLSPEPRLILIAFAAAAACLGACEGAFWTTIVELGGRFGGAAGGLMNTGGNIGGTLSPYLTPLLSGYFAANYGSELGWRYSLAVAGGVSILGALLWIGVDSRPTDDEGRPV
ncbi:MAG TPA: MFS transporter [Pirellulales bacterium]|nr:MFS transporter [Pirellulales bacterium]